VYLSFYSAQFLEKFFAKYKDFHWNIFTKDVKQKVYKDNITLFPVNNEEFIESMCSGVGVITGGGFEAPTEALYLGKKLMVIPLMLQYEQYCNAEAFRRIGVRVVRKVDDDFDIALKDWLYNDSPIRINFPDNAKIIAETVINFAKEEFKSKES
jgi:uncharacterized protein (TIGR00661 family)